jgi:hypothetical protein
LNHSDDLLDETDFGKVRVPLAPAIFNCTDDNSNNVMRQAKISVLTKTPDAFDLDAAICVGFHLRVGESEYLASQ